jgi:aspartyl-tRNA(Asn)/glutamyl-tRNA(Gln) amidotransferase subunit A
VVTTPSDQIDRLRINAARAGVRVNDDDLAAIRGGPFLAGVANFERQISDGDAAMPPDSLKDWQPSTPVASAGETPAWSTSDDPLDPFAPLHVVAAALAARDVSPVEVTGRVLDRIAALDRPLNAYQQVTAEQARASARTAEREIMAGQYRGSLHGVPVAIKDLLAVAGLPTTAGSIILADQVAAVDATAVRLLREAGAIIIGTTRMAEFAYSPASNNAHFGPTHNPWQTGRDTGGSSSGSAAAVAAGLAHLALGSDTGCSIRTPAALCGIVGLKPTHGRVSLAGAVTLSWSFDHLGPMTRSVHDAALALNVLAGHDPDDPRTRRGAVPDFAAGLGRDVLAGTRVGAIREDASPVGPAEPDALAAWEAGLAALRDAGADVTDLAIPDLEGLRVCGSPIINLEALAFHEPWLRSRPQDYGAFPRQRLLTAFAYGPAAYIQAQQLRARLRDRLNAIWTRVDYLSTPALGYGAPALGDPRSNTRFMVPFNALGWPAIVVPTGLTADGLPLATQIVGRPWDEAGVLQVAHAIERAGLLANRRPSGIEAR